MAEARAAGEWAHTSAVLAMLANCHRDPKKSRVFTPTDFNPLISEFLEFVLPAALGRKWLMVSTLPLIIVGIMRYAQLIYEKRLGEAPERLITNDRFLLTTVALWGLSVILFIYVL